MKLSYTAYDRLGNATDGMIESPDAVAATEALRRQGLFVAQLDTASVDKAPERTRRLSLPLRRGQKIKHVAVFTRHLHVLLQSGTQLVQAIGALERQTKAGPWRQAVIGLRTRIEEGTPLAEALRQYPQYFDAIYCSCVSAGESSGHLSEMLDRLASLKQKQLRIRNAVIGAMIYPSLLALVAVTILPVLLILVVPRFASLFATLDVPLPSSTRFLLSVSGVLQAYWWLIVLLPGVAVAWVAVFFRTRKGEFLRDTIVLKIPCLGGVSKSLTTARIVRLLGVLTEGHVPVLESLQFVRRASGNLHYARLISQAEEYVSKGEPLHLAFADPWLIPPSVCEAIRSGEGSGHLDRLLLNIADFLDEENEVIVRSLASIVEPLILIVMGALVGLISVSMFTPLFDLTSMTQGGPS